MATKKKVSLAELLSSKKAGKVIVSEKDKAGAVVKQTTYPVKGFAMPKAGRLRFRVLTADDKYLGQRDMVFSPKSGKKSS